MASRKHSPSTRLSEQDRCPACIFISDSPHDFSYDVHRLARLPHPMAQSGQRGRADRGIQDARNLLVAGSFGLPNTAGRIKPAATHVRGEVSMTATRTIPIFSAAAQHATIKDEIEAA